jgi:hypothetical protein
VHPVLVYSTVIWSQIFFWENPVGKRLFCSLVWFMLLRERGNIHQREFPTPDRSISIGHWRHHGRRHLYWWEMRLFSNRLLEKWLGIVRFWKLCVTIWSCPLCVSERIMFIVKRVPPPLLSTWYVHQRGMRDYVCSSVFTALSSWSIGTVNAIVWFQNERFCNRSPSGVMRFTACFRVLINKYFILNWV